jgi:hypothetical protein
MRALIVAASIVFPSLGLAKGAANPVSRFCGAEPKTDPAQNAEAKRLERLLQRLLTTRARVFNAYRNQYDQNRKRIIERNKKVPKQQRMKVPPVLSDEELRATKEYRRREKTAHASPPEERELQAKLQVEVEKRNRAQKKYNVCSNTILTRMRTAGSKSADQIRKIPADQRLAEESGRLAQLREQHLATMEIKRKDKDVMAPIISASICAHKNLLRETKREIKVLERTSKSRDVSAELTAANERSEEHALEVTELKRDIKNLRMRAKSCRKLAPLVKCIENHRRTAGRVVPPVDCKAYLQELELLGYFKQRWD